MGSLFMDHLVNAKSNSRIPIIAEIKVSSPTSGNILRGRNHTQIALAYQELGVACISVVTGKWFNGDITLLEDVAKNVDLPLLRKDFIVSKSELVRSKESGASAVLLTKKLLSTDHIVELCHQTKELGLTPFVEAASRDELINLPLPEQCILAVNNNDIISKETNGYGYEHSLSLVNDAKATNADALVSASGIANATEGKLLISAGYDGLLIGTSLLKASNLRDELNQYTEALCNIS